MFAYRLFLVHTPVGEGIEFCCLLVASIRIADAPLLRGAVFFRSLYRSPLSFLLLCHRFLPYRLRYCHTHRGFLITGTARLDAANGKVQHESLIVSPGPVECCYGTDSSFKPFNNNYRNETSAPGSSRSRSQVGILIKKKLFNQRPLAMGSMVNREPVGF